MLNKKAQGSLEITIVFICLFLLIGGIMKIWFWMNYNIVQRQRHYNETRVAAGTSPDGLAASYQEQWPAKDDYHDVDLITGKDVVSGQRVGKNFDPFYVGINAKE